MRKEILVPVLVAVSLLSILAVGWSVLFKSGSEPTTFKDFIGLLPAVISFLGVTKEEKKAQPSKRRAKTVPSIGTNQPAVSAVEHPFRLEPSFESGLYGGLIGGAIAGLIIGVVYYNANRGSPEVGLSIIPQIFVFSCVTGMIFGASSQLTIIWFRYQAREKKHPGLLFNEVTGGILGGGVAGIVTGAFGGWFFGILPIPFPAVDWLFMGSILGTSGVILGALFYNYQGSWPNFRHALITSVLALVVVSAFAVPVMTFVLVQTAPAWVSLFESAELLKLAAGGGILGFAVAIVLGLQLGVALRVYRVWESVTN